MDEDSISAMCTAHGPVVSDGRFSAGAIFGDWRLTAFIGRGGNGEVYCAEHVALGTSAALKVKENPSFESRESSAEMIPYRSSSIRCQLHCR